MKDKVELALVRFSTGRPIAWNFDTAERLADLGQGRVNVHTFFERELRIPDIAELEPDGIIFESLSIATSLRTVEALHAECPDIPIILLKGRGGNSGDDGEVRAAVELIAPPEPIVHSILFVGMPSEVPSTERSLSAWIAQLASEQVSVPA